MIKREEINKVCYHLYSPQNTPDQLIKRSGEWYCCIHNKYIQDIKECTKENCSYYYSVEERFIDEL